MSSFADPGSLVEMVAAQKRGVARGVTSVCSANRFVIEACMLQALEDGGNLLIETTCNQVNQYGGYTGMTPADFAAYLAHIAGEMGFPTRRLILGGDHLGPNPWQDEPAPDAMRKSRDLVRDCVRAGYAKIHLDASMRCADDDPLIPLAPEVSAARAADLCAVAEEVSGAARPVYVVGTEVPVPGGTAAEDGPLQVTGADDARRTLDLFRTAFEQRGLAEAWQRVIGLVVQPGVEYGSADVHEYDREQARGLSHMIESVPGIVYEAHSTDYQRPVHLRQLVEDHFAILKVGPALTFAFREAVFALARIEQEWAVPVAGCAPSNLLDVAEHVMLDHPRDWAKYYPGSPAEQAFARRYSLSDRIRYYWPQTALQDALQTLLNNLTLAPPPLPLLSQHLPAQYARVREGILANEPRALIHDYIRDVAAQYVHACAG